MMKLMKFFAVFLVCFICCNSAVFAGYTHYFTWKIDPTDPRLGQCVAEMNALIAARKNILDNKSQTSQFAGSDLVHFDGIGSDAYEEFIFPGNTVSQNFSFPHPTGQEIGFNFCKTEYRPYDEVVTACLIASRDFYTPEELEIGSDGSWDDWQAGRTLYENTFHRSPQNPLVSTQLLPSVGPVTLMLNKITGSALITFIIGAAILFQWLKQKQTGGRY